MANTKSRKWLDVIKRTLVRTPLGFIAYCYDITIHSFKTLQRENPGPSPKFLDDKYGFRSVLKRIGSFLKKLIADLIKIIIELLKALFGIGNKSGGLRISKTNQGGQKNSIEMKEMHKKELHPDSNKKQSNVNNSGKKYQNHLIPTLKPPKHIKRKED